MEQNVLEVVTFTARVGYVECLIGVLLTGIVGALRVRPSTAEDSRRWPAVVVGLALLVGISLLFHLRTYILPTFVQIYEGLGRDVPVALAVVIALVTPFYKFPGGTLLLQGAGLAVGIGAAALPRGQAGVGSALERFGAALCLALAAVFILCALGLFWAGIGIRAAAG